MADRLVNVTLTANTAPFVAGMNSATAATQRTTASTATMSAGMKRTGASMAQVAGGAGLLRGGLVTPLTAAGVALGGVTKASIDWESSWAGVTKTVDGSATQMERLQGDLRNMATELPATHGEIAGVAEAAGQLGIAVDDVADFSRVMIDLGETTNLTADQAATNIARITNIMGTAEGDVDKFGAALVDLGNNSATTEAEILEFVNRIAAAGNVAGLSESDLLGFGAALSSVGVRAERGGTALSKVFIAVRDSVIDADERLGVFAGTAGMSAEQFATAFREDPAQAIATFIAGLGEMNAAGESTTAVFEGLELTDQRLMQALLATAEAGDLLTDSIGLSSDAWKENTALAEEAERRYQTTAARLQMSWNRIKDAAIDVGAPIAEVFADLVGLAADFAAGVQEIGDAFDDLPDLGIREDFGSREGAFTFLDSVTESAKAGFDPVTALAMAITGVTTEAEAAAGWTAKYDQEIQGMLRHVPEATEVTAAQTQAQAQLNAETVTGAESLANYQDELHSATDPVFALQSRLEAVDEAQKAYNESVDTYGKNSPEAGAAALDLAEAVAAAEQAAIDGDLSFDAFDARLERWVQQGIITAEQADAIRGRVEDLTGASDDFEGTRTAQFESDGVAAEAAKIAHLNSLADRWRGSHSATFISNFVSGTTGNLFAGRGHDGGMVTTAGVQRFHGGGEVTSTIPRFHQGTTRLAADEVPAILQVGEAVVSKRDMAMAAAGGGTMIHATFVNRGVIGSQLEMENWLAQGVDNLNRKGRLPLGTS